MANGFLSQEEIDSLLRGGTLAEPKSETKTASKAEPKSDEGNFADEEKDLIGEIGNISMGAAATALSQIINQSVNITTPVVSITTLAKLKSEFETPNIALEVQFVSGILGKNLMVMRIPDAGVIASLMMGGDGKVETKELSEIERSAVSEAMNQMMGSAATAMATMFQREVNISPPVVRIIEDVTSKISDDIDEDKELVKILFKLKVPNLIDSYVMQLLPIETVKRIQSIMSHTEEESPKPESKSRNTNDDNDYVLESKEAELARPKVEVHQAAFQPLETKAMKQAPKNIELIMDVKLEVSVVLGRTKKTIRDILNLGTGSLVELDKLSDEPVEVLVNGKVVAYGEVVVVDENFGVRITSIVDSSERVKSMAR